MTAAGKSTALIPPIADPIADPGARRRRRSDGEWWIWLGWGLAALLHGGLLAALIFSWPARLNPAPPNPAAISLLMVAAENPGQQPAVRPKPPDQPTFIPAAPPAIIANSRPANKRKLAPALPKASAVLLPPKLSDTASRGAVATKPLPQQAGDRFVAARPMAGNVNQPPEYPEAAYDHGEQGDVLLSIHVLPNGVADSVSVTQSSGYGILDAAASNAAWKWRFQPSTLSGQAVPSVVPCWVHFVLNPAKPEPADGAFCQPD